MTDTIGAPSTGADVSGASSSAPTTPAPAGPPSRSSLARSFQAKRAETPKTEPASPVEGTQDTGALGAGEPAKQPEGDTASLDAGKGDKPNESKEPESIPMAAFKERLGKEKARREKLETDLHTVRGEIAKRDTIIEAMAKENERLLEAMASGQAFDEKGEELHGLKLQQEVKEQLARQEAEHQAALENLRREAEREMGAESLVKQWRADIAAARADYPLVSEADMKAAIRKDPHIDIRKWAQAEHEQRVATFMEKQRAQQAATSTLPTTVAKPTGVSKFDPPLNAKGMAQAFKHVRAKT